MPFIGKKIETTSDHFGKAVRGNYLLVDKTIFIKEFLDGQDTSLITRPRRFGKTLAMSMLQHFFAAEVDDVSTQGLFDQFAIAKVDNGQFLKEHQGKYPVIFVTFKEVKQSSFTASMNQIKGLMTALYLQHEALLNATHLSDSMKKQFQKYLDGNVDEQDLEGGIKYLSNFLYKASGNKQVIILIDEYDTPLTAAYEYKYIDQMSNFMRILLGAALKGNNFLRKGLMTGILRVSKNSMLSDLNNLKVYTVLDNTYEQYFGFTEDEVKELMGGFQVTVSLDNIRAYYNGYKIGRLVIYNPWSIMSFFQANSLEPFWVWSANDLIIKMALINSDAPTKQQLLDLMKGKTIEGEIDINLRYEDLVEKQQALWTLLVFCGYLKVDSKKLKGSRFICQLKIPNNEILIQYNEAFGDWLKEKIGTEQYDSFLKSLVEGRVDEFTKSLTLYLASCTSSYDFQAESDYHSFLLGLLCSITGTHYLYSNKEYGTGRPDCLLIPKDNTKTQGIILEFKHTHFKNEEYKKDVAHLKKSGQKFAEEALAQITTRGYDYGFAQHSQITHVLQVGIAFSNRIVSSGYVTCPVNKDLPLALTNNNNNVAIFHAISKPPTSKLFVVSESKDAKTSKDTPIEQPLTATAKKIKTSSGKRIIKDDSSSDESKDSLLLTGYKTHGIFGSERPMKKTATEVTVIDTSLTITNNNNNQTQSQQQQKIRNSSMEFS